MVSGAGANVTPSKLALTWMRCPAVHTPHSYPLTGAAAGQSGKFDAFKLLQGKQTDPALCDFCIGMLQPVCADGMLPTIHAMQPRGQQSNSSWHGKLRTIL